MSGINPFEGEIAQDETAIVAEMAVNPVYIGECARKLISAGVWDMTENAAIRRVSKAVQALVSQREDDEYRLKEIAPEQRVGSMHTTLGSGGDNFGGSRGNVEWNDYVLFQMLDVDFQREAIRRVSIPIGFGEKEEIIHELSSVGREQSKLMEEIMTDNVAITRSAYDEELVERTEYTSPRPDFIISDYRYRVPVAHDVEKTKIIEISNRWENPIGRPYIEQKMDEAMRVEEETGLETDVLIVAPRFTGDIALELIENEENIIEIESGIVSVAQVPAGAEGTPVIVRDSETTQLTGREGGLFVGPEYPIVHRAFDRFIDNLTSVDRDYTVIRELELRQELSVVLTDFLSG